MTFPAKILLLALALILILGFLAVLFLTRKDQTRTVVKPVADSFLSPTPSPPLKLLTYEDLSGFSFSYPDNLKVDDQTPVNSDYYSLLFLEKDGQEIIQIAIKETQFKTVASWLKASLEAPKGAKLVGAVSLDKIAASLYETQEKIIAVAVDLNTLYLLVGDKSDLWRPVYDQLLSSFKFSLPQTETAGPQEAPVVYESEEVIE